MRKFVARRNKETVFREPVCPQSWQKRSLCAHCRQNPIIAFEPGVEVRAVTDAPAEARCQLRKNHIVVAGDEIGLAYIAATGDRIGWVCSGCVAGLPFVPDPEQVPDDPGRTVSSVPNFGWTIGRGKR